ncbi:putative LPS assembly protein LptD [Blattabacterium cuenoti]|uniref:putative LPS assembly protein LptD n=1 Tax=Blattabacterium cuenoti TaxID=1653831 RepID=UPI001EEB0B18|nr:putative LPS assembly protein LptD [Blattabacterium cuenoti]
MMLFVSIFVYANEKKENNDYQINNFFKDFENVIKYKSNIQEHNIKEGKSFLKGKASIEYDDIKIQADCIEFNWNNGDLHAIQKEKFILFQQGNHQYTFSDFHINLKSKKIEAKDFHIKSKNHMIIASSIEKKDQNTSLMKKITYISDPFFLKKKDNDPDFYLKTSFLKYFHFKKYIFSGPVFFYWYQVPMPIFFPFLYIPVKELNKNFYEMIYPKIGIQNKRIYVEDMGLFLPISNLLNFKILSSIYNTDKWNLKTRMEYKLKYSYNGFFDFNYQSISNKQHDYQFQWKHNQDYKSDSDTKFNANINYNKNILSDNNDNESLSYLSMKKKFSNYLLFLDAYMVKKNNNNKGKIKFIIPELIFHMKNMFFNNQKNFFLHHTSIENKILIHNSVESCEKKVSFYTGFNHKMNISTYFSFFDSYLKISPKFFYEEFYIWKFPYTCISNLQKIDFLTDLISIPFNRTLEIKKNVFLLKHQIEPVLSFYVRYFPPVFHHEKNYFEKKINFILNNDLDVQIKNKFNEYQKIKMLKNLSSSFLVDQNTIKLDNLHIVGHADFTKNLGLKYKGGINFVGKKKKMNKVMYFDFSFFCNYDTNFFSDKNEYRKKGKNRYDYFLFDKENYAKYSIPFSFKIDFHYNYENYINQKKLFNAFLGINGSVNITKYWKIDIHTDYDLFKKKIIFTNIIFYRDLRSFKMSFNWIPMKNPSWHFFIGIKDPNLSNIIQYNEKN